MTILKIALDAIDEANGADPNQVNVDGEEVAKTLLYGQRMTAWLGVLAPNAPAALQIACRAQHVRRWQSPRTTYPEGRVGYKKWRAELLLHHAQEASVILSGLALSSSLVERVSFLLTKQNRTTDLDVQILEDVACLVFLQYELGAFSARHENAKVVTVLQRTWKKMSKKAQDFAVKIEYPSSVSFLLKEALL